MSADIRRVVICISLRRQVCAEAIAAAIQARNWSWGYVWRRVAQLPFMSPSAGAIWPTATAPVGVRRGILEFEGCIDAAGVLFIARRHFGTMFIHHVGLKIDSRTKHNEFAGLATRVGTWVVRLLKMLLLKTRSIRY